MSRITELADFVGKLKCQVRLKLKVDEAPEIWARGIGLPVDGYIELHGPSPFREVEWLEINPAVIEHIGRLVEPKQHNYLEEIGAFLLSKNIAYLVKEGIVRISFSELVG
ncbi:DUF6678 family protein [Hymenobacter sp. BT559]|uniref:DUF6678 family protein n=1 Tax=Hymenobacter sp. BT559 TaxID=2795729 RepID=UPI0018EE07C6|nr:DUF6678 family protein [Hymenobacter sp. BT559]MBJ6143895.1 hypothetical protein [Hymenobacter sp. BT559]